MAICISGGIASTVSTKVNEARLLLASDIARLSAAELSKSASAGRRNPTRHANCNDAGSLKIYGKNWTACEAHTSDTKPGHSRKISSELMQNSTQHTNRMELSSTDSPIWHSQSLEVFRVVPSLSDFCCHRSPRHGILKP
jgi:hypothetical protein